MNKQSNLTGARRGYHRAAPVQAPPGPVNEVGYFVDRVAAASAKPDKPEPVDYENWTLARLKKEIASRGLEIRSGAHKTEYVKLLLKFDGWLE